MFKFCPFARHERHPTTMMGFMSATKWQPNGKLRAFVSGFEFGDPFILVFISVSITKFGLEVN